MRQAMIITDQKNVFSEGEKQVILHKSQLVEAIAGLRSLYLKSSEKLHSIRDFSIEFEKLDETVRYSLNKYGEAYSGWLLIMDIATYISCAYYDRTGKTDISFETAMEEYDKMDEVTYLYIFLGMPALGYEKADAARWLRDTDTMSSKDRQVIGQYIAQKDIKIFIRNIAELKEDLKELLTVYWEKVFRRVWQEIEKSIDKTIDTAAYECRMLGDISQYIANMHKDIKVAKGSIHINKEVPYDIKLSDVKQVHIFPSTFSGEELLIDIFDRSLVIYYNLNLDDSRQVGEEGKKLCKIFKILGDDTRLRIARLLWGSPATTQYLAGMLGMSPSTVSAHLKMMRSAGLVTNKAVKKFVYYEIDQKAMAELGEELLDYLKN